MEWYEYLIPIGFFTYIFLKAKFPDEDDNGEKAFKRVWGKCPNCRKEVSRLATKCPHCTSDI